MAKGYRKQGNGQETQRNEPISVAAGRMCVSGLFVLSISNGAFAKLVKTGLIYGLEVVLAAGNSFELSRT